MVTLRMIAITSIVPAAIPAGTTAGLMKSAPARTMSLQEARAREGQNPGVGYGARLTASRAVRQRDPQGRRARGVVLPVQLAFRAEMEVRSSSGSRRRARSFGREAPWTAGDGPVQTPAFMIPVAPADVAVVRVDLPCEQLLTAGAQGTILRADERKVPRIRDGNATGERGGSRMLPAVTGAASMRMFGVRTAHQRLALWIPSSTVGLAGPSSNAR